MPADNIEEGDWVYFDLGHGVETGKVEAIRAAEVDVGIPLDGPRTLSRGEIYDTATACAEAAIAAENEQVTANE